MYRLSFAGLVQLEALEFGFISIYDNKIDLVGISHDGSISHSDVGCRILTKFMPKGARCGFVYIQYVPHQHGRGGGKGKHGYRDYDSVAEPFVAVDPKKFAEKPLNAELSDPRVVDILFATTRKRDDEDNADNDDTDVSYAPTFSGERGKALTFGRARVRIPEDHRTGRLEMPAGLFNAL
jgi:hypothetical protein